MTRWIFAVIVAAALCGGCKTEIRNGNEVWACEDNPQSPAYGGCVDTGTRIY